MEGTAMELLNQLVENRGRANEPRFSGIRENALPPWPVPPSHHHQRQRYLLQQMMYFV